jgi:hypothetical protein
MKKLIFVIEIIILMSLLFYISYRMSKGKEERIEIIGQVKEESLDIGIHSLVEIGNCIYCDLDTGIVYWWNGWNYGTGELPSPYYSANGNLCRYNRANNSIEEIKGD